MPRCYVSIGSNIDAEANVRSSLRALEARFGDLRVSPLYRTAAVGFSGDDFVNAVAAIDSQERAETIHQALRQIEDDHGRKREGDRFSPRTLDLDLILYGDALIETPGLVIPRDEIEHYAFVLKPLCDLCPDCRYPRSGETYRSMWSRMKTQQSAQIPEPL